MIGHLTITLNKDTGECQLSVASLNLIELLQVMKYLVDNTTDTIIKSSTVVAPNSVAKEELEESGAEQS